MTHPDINTNIKWNQEAVNRIFGGWSYIGDAPQEYYDLMSQIPGAHSEQRVRGLHSLRKEIKYGVCARTTVELILFPDGYLHLRIGYKGDKKYPVKFIEEASCFTMQTIIALAAHGIVNC